MPNIAFKAIPTTPRLPLRTAVRAFCASLSHRRPVLLPYVDVASGYQARFCHVNVLHRVRQCGGRRIYGWLVWESQFLDAEFHSVWQPPGSTDELVDVTPRVDGEEYVLFVPDPVRRIEKREFGDLTWASRTNVPGLRPPWVQERHCILRDAAYRAYMEDLGLPPDASVAD